MYKKTLPLPHISSLFHQVSVVWSFVFDIVKGFRYSGWATRHQHSSEWWICLFRKNWSVPLLSMTYEMQPIFGIVVNSKRKNISIFILIVSFCLRAEEYSFWYQSAISRLEDACKKDALKNYDLDYSTTKGEAAASTTRRDPSLDIFFNTSILSVILTRCCSATVLPRARIIA